MGQRERIKLNRVCPILAVYLEIVFGKAEQLCVIGLVELINQHDIGISPLNNLGHFYARCLELIDRRADLSIAA